MKWIVVLMFSGLLISAQTLQLHYDPRKTFDAEAGHRFGRGGLSFDILFFTNE